LIALFLTDVHENFGALFDIVHSNDPDVVLLGGDILSNPDLSLLRDIFLLLNDFSSEDILFVPGNWEPIEILLWDMFGRSLNIHASRRTIGEYTFCGIGGSAPRIFFFPLELNIEDIEYYAGRLQDIGEVSVFISHMIPYDCVVLKNLIHSLSPKVALCGHIHEKIFIRRDNGTIVANPGAVYDGRYSIVNIDEGEVLLRNTGDYLDGLNMREDSLWKTLSDDPSSLRLLPILDTIYMGYPKYRSLLKRTGITHLLRAIPIDGLYGLALYRTALISRDYSMPLLDEDTLLRIIGRNAMYDRWVIRIIRDTWSGSPPRQILEPIIENLRRWSFDEICFSLLDILRMPTVMSLHENTLAEIFDMLHSKIPERLSLHHVFLLLANAMLSNQKFLGIEDIIDSTHNIIEDASLDSLGILIEGLSRYTSRELLEKLAHHLKPVINEKLEDTKTTEVEFFRRRISMLMPRDSIFVITLADTLLD